MSYSSRLLARAYLPSRSHYYYARCKLALDPLYRGVWDALQGATGSVLDLGCGIGLLAHVLRAEDSRLNYLGVDSDAAKIAIARQSLDTGNNSTLFEVCDLANGLPHWRGHIVLLDLLQYLPPPRQLPLIEAAVDALGPGCRLVIRTGLHSSGWRSRITWAADRFGHASRWMSTRPMRYPEREELLDSLSGKGLTFQIEPLHRGTPFNNWLIVAERVPPMTRKEGIGVPSATIPG